MDINMPSAPVIYGRGGCTAEVAVEDVSLHFDKPYAYAVPHGLRDTAVPGARVVVPFGRGNRHRSGIIIRTYQPKEEKCIKPLLSVEDQHPLIGSDLIELALWLKSHTFCSMYEALRLMLPAGASLKLRKAYSFNQSAVPGLELLTGDERAVADYLYKSAKPVPEEKIASLRLCANLCLLDIMVKKGILIREDIPKPGTREHSEQILSLAVGNEEAAELMEPGALTPKQRSAVKTAMSVGAASAKEIAYYSGVSQSVLNGLVKKGVFTQSTRQIRRDPYKNLSKGSEAPPPLSDEQSGAYHKLAGLLKGDGSAAMLYGVTGSGKTQVFMRLIADVVTQGRGVIVLVPEISLTPQAVAQFYNRFGGRVAVLHSGLSIGERYDEWSRLKDGRASIAVGTRSAVFAPVQNLGLIIIDEEQEYTYKSESSPRYHARDAARFRCAKSGALLLLASATPSVETAYRAAKGKYTLVTMKNRFGNARLPDVITVDMKDELRAGNNSPFSARLLEELKENIRSGQQSILLLNRRGHNTFVSCAECGHVLKCPNCSIALTYHSANGRLMCHYCGYSGEAVHSCPECGGRFIRYAGTGTQKAEQALMELFPGARILRMDADTTQRRYSHETILKKFGSGEYDILIGTQMVAKGLDFENVTLVGVLSADQSLYSSDFRATERTFSLITQVVGRSGRGSLHGRAVIQTQTPENETLRLAAAQDYGEFYRREIMLRQQLLYPPFCDICEIGFTGVEEEAVAAAAEKFFVMMKAEVAKAAVPARMMNPSQASIPRIGGRYRYRIMIKCKNTSLFREIVIKSIENAGRDKLYKKVAVFADMNPLNIL